MRENRDDVRFEELEAVALSLKLKKFYAEACSKDGEHYSKSSLINIRSGLNRHLTSPPYNKQFNLMKDVVFQSANQVVTGLIKELRRDGLDTTKNKTAIEPEDVELMYSSGVLSNKTPQSLQYKVFFELCLNFGRRGKEGLRELKKSSFVVAVDAGGRKYVKQTFHEKEKNHQGVSMKEKEKSAVMYEKCEKPDLCPVKSFELYFSKLNPLCDSLFQRPKKYANVKDAVWYDNMPLGHNKIGGMMKEIGQKAGLSTIYTNHCIRATTTTVLFQAGLEGERITNVTGHRSTTSLKPYIKAPTQYQKREASEILGKYASPVSERQMAAPSSSVSSPEPATAIRPTTNSAVSSLPLSTPPTGLGSLFAGATLGSNCTININFNAGHYTATVSNNEVWINVLHLSWNEYLRHVCRLSVQDGVFFVVFFLQIPSGHMTQSYVIVT